MTVKSEMIFGMSGGDFFFIVTTFKQRVKLHVPKEETFSTPLEYIDVVGADEYGIGLCCWNVVVTIDGKLNGEHYSKKYVCVKNRTRTHSRKKNMSRELSRDVRGQLSEDSRKKFENYKMCSTPDVSLRSSRLLRQQVVQGQSTLQPIHHFSRVFLAVPLGSTCTILLPHGRREDRQEVFLLIFFFF